MKTVIYLDELLLVNFLIAAFLLPGTGVLCGTATAVRRIAAASAMAALSSLLLLAPRLPFLFQLAAKTLSAAVCVRIAFPGQSVRSFLRSCAWYLLLNLTLAGVVSGMILTKGADGVETNNLTIYWNVSPMLLLGCVTVVWLTLRLLLVCFEHPRPGASEKLTLHFMERDITVQAFCDTGLMLQQLSGGQCGVVVNYRAVEPYLSPFFTAYLRGYFESGKLQPPLPEWRLRLVPCNTAVGMGIFPAVAADWAAVTRNGTTYRCRALVMFSEQSFPHGCGAAYSTELLESANALSERGTVECRR